ncbi:DUF488 domain-containing protein [Pseudoclavibacter helvolus]|uniref:DUF488 domain-containing protein n=1 Tax=Pseudoclavibacter helvolus TaxID=255205 RepID=UPI003C724B42
MAVTMKRVYEAPTEDDGFRVLVDRLWPRGLSKARAELDAWVKDAAPSDVLRRRWHADPAGHDPAHFAAFADDYRAELAVSPARDGLALLAQFAREHDQVTLLYGARDETTNHAVVLRDALRRELAS